MPKIKYEEKKFRSEALAIIEQANIFIADYASQGLSLTLRQLYYRFVSRALIPNTEKSYTRLGNIISDARRAGMIDWDAIVDRTRFLRTVSNWGKPQDILQSAMDSYHRDLWASQPTRIEVWIEKDALVGVINEVCRTNDVPFFSCRGYVSDSEMWAGARRQLRFQKKEQKVLILHLGDHDPSGIDMTRDITDRLYMFAGYTNIKVRRIALTMEQITDLNPPPNPAKITDSRYESYRDIYGEESWELDALEPQYIIDLIATEINAVRDAVKWQAAVKEQEAERGQIEEVIQKWDELFENEDDNEEIEEDE